MATELENKLRLILTDKNTNLLPENLKKGVTCLGVEGTAETGTEINNQDKEITENGTYTADEGYTGLGTVTVNISASSTKPNIFLQDTEPETKEGIWLKSSDLTYDDVLIDSNISVKETWESDRYNTIPFSFYNGGIATVGTDIYLFGGSATSSTAYKYDTLTNKFTQITNIPAIYPFYGGQVASIGTNIYLCGSWVSGSPRDSLYKYDTLTNTYTKLTSMPRVKVDACAVAVGDYIYIIGGWMATTNMMKFAPSTNSYETLTDIPFAFQNGQAISVGNTIYLFGGTDNPTTAYKYNIDNNLYTQIANIPFSFVNGSIAKNGTDIYLFGGSNASTTVYKYDTNSNTYTQLDDIPYSFYNGDSTYVGEYIYIFGGEGDPTMVRRLSTKIEGYPNNSILLLEGNNGYKTQLVNSDIQGRTVTSIIDAWHYTTENGVNETLPTYYGDGTQWNCFKNE